MAGDGSNQLGYSWVVDAATTNDDQPTTAKWFGEEAQVREAFKRIT